MIGILTQPLRRNYGGILQAYALQTILKRMGHEAYMVRLAPNKPTFTKKCVIHVKNLCKRLWGRRPARVIKERVLDEVVYKHLNNFIHNRITPVTGVIKNMRQLRQMDEKLQFDAYVVGSDQVWRKEYAYQFFPGYFCAFTNREIIRFAYAASFGTSHWNASPKEISQFREEIKKFSLVTVREESGIQLCKDYLGCAAEVALDPTMLLTREDYLELLSPEIEQRGGGVFEYILDRSDFKEDISRKVQEKLGISSFTLDVPDVSSSAPLEEIVMHPVEEWIQSFEQADFIVTDSFHGCVFSILFNKPFLVIGNQTRGLERFHTLLNHFGLRSRLIEVNAISYIDGSEIDWGAVNVILEEWRKRSKEFLSIGISNGQR